MRALDLFGILLHWIGGFIGVSGCLFGFAALPGLLEVDESAQPGFMLFDIPFSTNILDAFPPPWHLVVLAAGVFLFAWLCFLFLFSTHILITAVSRTLNHYTDGSGAAWLVVLILGVALSASFVVLLYGATFNQQTVAVCLLILAITSFLFVANYTESDEGEPHVISYQ